MYKNLKKIIAVLLVLSIFHTTSVFANESDNSGMDSAEEEIIENDFRLKVIPNYEEPKRDINIRTIQNRIRNQHKRQKNK